MKKITYAFRRLNVKAYEVVRYAAATPEDDVARTLAKSNPIIGGKRISELSTRALAAQTRALVAKTRRKRRDPAEREARRVARQAQAALRKTASRGVVVTAVRGDGGWCVRLEVPLEDVSAIVGGGGRDQSAPTTKDAPGA